MVLTSVTDHAVGAGTDSGGPGPRWNVVGKTFSQVYCCVVNSDLIWAGCKENELLSMNIVKETIIHVS